MGCRIHRKQLLHLSTIASVALFPFNVLLGLTMNGSQALAATDRWDTVLPAKEPITIAQTLHRPEQSVLGVLYGQDSSWANIGQDPSLIQQHLREQLERSGIPFRLLPVNTLADAATLNRYSFLFLVNAAELSNAEVLGLEAWLQRGGRLVVSGPVGTESSQSVRELLNRMLGGYWETYIDHPQSLRAQSSQTWLPGNGILPQISGGILIPTRLESQVLFTWQNPQEAAVLVNDRIIFLGWSWGEQAIAQNLDQAWLMASLDRFNHFTLPPANALQSNASQTPASRSTASQIPASQPSASQTSESRSTPSPSPSITSTSTSSQPPAAQSLSSQTLPASVSTPGSTPGAPNLTPSSNPASRSNQAPTLTQAPSLPRSAQPGGNPSIALNRPSPSTNPSTNPPTSSSTNSSTTSAIRSATTPAALSTRPAFPANFDPTQDVAPPGLEVGQGDEPIVFLEAVAMRKELSNLLGRFQSASFSVNVAGTETRTGTVTLDTAPASPQRLVKSLPEVTFPAHSPVNSPAHSPVNFPGNASTEAHLATVPPPIALVESVQKTLKAFPNTVASQNYALARQEWLQARDTLWQNYPDSQPLQPEIRAVWLDRGTIVKAGSPAGLTVLFDRLAEAGINVIFFETVNAGYPIYPSEVAPTQNPLTQGWDPLATAIDLAHDRQMELHAWIWAFAAGNRAHNRILGQPEDYLGPVLSQHPEWVNRDNRDEIWSAGKPFLDPAHPAARAYVHSLITEISDRYAVDGIQLDYIRYPFQDIAGGRTFGYGKAGRERFQQRTGVDPKTLTPQHPLWELWQNFRIEQIDTFVAEVGQNLRRNHPEMKLSVAVFAFPTHERLAKLQQNWEAWAKRGDVDLVCLMAYAMDTNRFEQLTDPWLSNTDLGGTLVTAGIHLLSLPDSTLVLDQVQFLRDHSTSGYVLFATQQFNEALQTRFRPLFPGQGRSSSVLPHRSPLQSAHLRYLALQQEWDLLSAQQQIWISSENRVAWDAARQSLDRALAEAARMPSAQTLHHATLELAQFRAEFPVWFDRHDLQNSYQVRTWQHRLSVLTILLHYGERMLDQSRPIALGF